jgi:nucleoside-diphosphate-sugar epimerase
VYFASYVQPPPLEGQSLWSDVEAATQQNLALLSNFLKALPLAEINPERILLQTGAKYYGLHLGPTSTPMEEEDPRHGIEGNFYFPQEDLLAEHCRKTGITWVVTRPCFILGAVENAAMNILWPLSIYAAVQAHLGLPLDFPGDVAAWDAVKQQSMSTLIAYHAEWALLTPEAGNQALNQCDDSMFAFGKFWPTLARWYQLPAGQPAKDSSAYSTITMPYPVPPRGFGGPGIVRASFSFLEWSKKPEVERAWEELKAKHSLKFSPFGDKAMDTFGLIDGEILGSWGRVISMDKNHQLGWHGTVRTEEAIKQVISEMAELKMVPPLV